MCCVKSLSLWEFVAAAIGSQCNILKYCTPHSQFWASVPCCAHSYIAPENPKSCILSSFYTHRHSCGSPLVHVRIALCPCRTSKFCKAGFPEPTQELTRLLQACGAAQVQAADEKRLRLLRQQECTPHSVWLRLSGRPGSAAGDHRHFCGECELGSTANEKGRGYLISAPALYSTQVGEIV